MAVFLAAAACTLAGPMSAALAQSSYTIAPDHPRIFIRPADLPALRAKCGIAGYENVPGVTFGEFETVFSDVMFETRNYPTREGAGMAAAFIHLVLDGADPTFLDIAKSHIADAGYDEVADLEGIFTFDWVYNDLTPTERATHATGFLNSYSFTGSFAHEFAAWGRTFFRQRTLKALIVLALYDNAELTSSQRQTVQTAADQMVSFYKDYLIPHDNANYAGGGYHEGEGYAHSRGGKLEGVAQFLEAWRTATGEDLLPTYAPLEGYGRWVMHSLVPATNYVARADDTDVNYYQPTLNPRMSLLIAGRLGDRRLQWLERTWTDEAASFYGDFGRHWRFTRILWEDKSLDPVDPTTLPTAVHLTGKGLVFMRSDWSGLTSTADGQTDATFAFFKAGDYYTGHQHCDQGSFVLHKREPLALDTGEVSDADWLGGYTQRTIAHNTMLIFDPAEQWNYGDARVYANDGGQICFGYSEGSFADYPDEKVPAGDILAYDHHPDSYTYAWGDVTGAYNSTRGTVAGNRAKVSTVQREFLYLRSADSNADYFVVADRVSKTDPTFTTQFLLHSQNEPAVNGSVVATLPTEGATDYSGDLVTMTNGTANLYSRTLLPAQRVIRKRGGAGFDFWNDGQNWPGPGEGSGQQFGHWRIEVEPTQDATDHFFLHVLHPTVQGAQPAPTSLVTASGGTMQGALIALANMNRVAMFSSQPQGQAPSGTISYSLTPTTNSVEHLLFNLTPNTRYRVTTTTSGSTLNVSVVPDTAGGALVSPAGILRFVSDGPTQTANAAPTITSVTASPAITDPGQSVSFTVAAQDLDGSIASYAWDFGDGLTGSGAAPAHVYPMRGSYDVEVVVTDNAGLTSVGSLTVQVRPAGGGNLAPVVTASATPTDVNPGQTVAFSATASDADGTVTGYSWDFGDGATATGAAVSHAYASVGTYSARATATDDAGGIGMDTVTITVTTPPVLSIDPVATSVSVSGTRTFTATNGTPPYTFSVTGVGSIDSATGVYTAPATTGAATVRVTDAVGDFAEASVTVVELGAAPPVVGDATMWLVADAGVPTTDGAAVTTWSDQSGNGNDMTQASSGSRPVVRTNVLNGHPVLRFDGVNDWLGSSFIPATGNAPRTFVVVLANGVDTANAYDHVLHYGSTTYPGAYGLTFASSSGQTGGANMGNHYWGGGYSSQQPPTAAPTILVARYDGSQDRLFANGTDSGGFTETLNTGTANGLKLGSRLDGGAEVYQGDIAEVMVFDRALTAAERESIECYLAGRYNISVATACAPNAPPTIGATASPLSARIDDTIAFSATTADSDGAVTSVTWNFGDGTTGTGATVSHAYSTDGTFTATATATDDDGATATATVSVTITFTQTLEVPGPPGPLSVPATDDDGTYTISWGAASGPVAWYDLFESQNADFSAPQWIFVGNTTQKTLTGRAPGTYYYYVTACNESAQCSEPTYGENGVVVEAANQPPTVTTAASPTTAETGQTITFTATADDADGTVASIDWTFGDGATATGASVTHAYAAAGTYTAQATATDDAGDTAAASVQVTITNRPPTVSAVATPTTTSTGTDVAFTATANDPDGSVASLDWNFDDGATATGPSVTHAYANMGSYLVSVTATDDAGAAATATMSVDITNMGPTIDSVSALPAMAAPNETIVFSVAASDPDGSIVAYDWDFGDGATATGATLNYAYAAGGTYTALVTVTDSDGAQANATVDVSIFDAGEAPAVVGEALLWLRADVGAGATSGAPVAAWQDSSPNGYDATQASGGSQPTFQANVLNGHPVVRFDGVNDWLDTTLVPATGTAPRSFVIVLTNGVDTANAYDHVLHYGAQSYPQAYGLTFGSNAGQTGGPNMGNHYWGGGYSSQQPPTSEPLIVVAQYDGTQDRLFANGADQGGFTANLNTGSTYALKIGSRLDGGPEPFQGDIAEVLAFDRVLSPTERESVECYMANRYGIPVAIACPTAEPVNEPPTVAATATPTPAQTGQTVAFNATAADADGTVASIAWTFGDGTTATGASVTHTYAREGTYTATATVTDDGGATASDSTPVGVAGAAAVTLTPAPTSPQGTGATVVWTAAASGGSGTYEYKFFQLGPGTNNVWTRVQDYSTADTYSWATGSVDVGTTYFQVWARNVGSREGYEARSKSVRFDITAPNLPPTVSAGASPPTAEVGEPITFSATAGDVDGSVTSVSWTFGDGAAGTGATVSHAYGTAGTYTATVTATDDDGAGAVDSVTVTVSAPNQPPTVSAGASPTTAEVGEPITFSATAADADGAVTGLAWTFGDGATGTGATVSHAYSTAGTYSATVTATDDDGANAVGSVTVTVSAPNQPPTVSASASPTSAQVEELITFTASASDPDGTMAGYRWVFGDGQTLTTNAASTSHTYAAPGTYTATVTAEDNDGATATAEVTVVVTELNAPPTVAVTASATELTVQTAFTFNSTVADADGQVVAGSWTFGDGATAAWSAGTSVNHAYTGAGTYTVTLTVTDDDGAQASDSVQVTVLAANLPPQVSVGVDRTAATPGTTLTFSSTVTDPDGQVVSSVWAWGDGATEARTGDAQPHTYQQAGTYTATLTVTDDGGASASASVTVDISADLTASISATTAEPVTGEGVTFTVELGAGFNTISTVVWDLGDGTQETRTGVLTVNHVYTVAGAYTVTADATDIDGRQARASRTLTVTEPAGQCTLQVRSPNGGETITAGETVTITWTGDTMGGGNLRIRLSEMGRLVDTIVSSTSNTGSYTWAVPSSLPPSTLYKILIFENGNARDCFDFSDSEFTVVAGAAEGPEPPGKTKAGK